MSRAMMQMTKYDADGNIAMMADPKIAKAPEYMVEGYDMLHA